MFVLKHNKTTHFWVIALLFSLFAFASISPSHAQTSSCSASAWNNTAIYVGGNTVSYNNRQWRAKWWVQGEVPGSTGAWGAWEDLGACSGGITPTIAPTTASTNTPAPTATATTAVSTPLPTATATVVSGGSCSAPQYLSGTTYVAGSKVSNKGKQYECKPYPYTGWCSASPAAYEPGVGFAWADAWTDLGACTVSGTATPVPTSTATKVATATATPVATATATKIATATATPVATATATPISTPQVTPVTGNAACRPEGLYKTPGLDVPYCTVYDSLGREKMGADHPRRIIGYFTSWRTGKNGQPAYLVNNIPWDKITHINYAFAHIDSQNRVSAGQEYAGNAATDMVWPGVAGAEMDPAFPYTGHFNLLNKYKKLHPDVRTLISIGGWAETGGYFDATGNRVNNGGFYRMTTNSDGTVNQAGINTFADSAVSFIRTYGFDGVDIDYEYPSSMDSSGNPLDFAISNPLRPYLVKSYIQLMKTLREKLDQASVTDGKHYMLTVAAPSSGYLLRGMETFQATAYLDYVNIMSYDLHGAWNGYVSHNAALFDTGTDPELTAANVYGTAQYGGIGYLNTDWSFHYFRGSMPAGRINIGVPYYTRGWQGVTGGTNGLNGTAALPTQSDCPTGTGLNDKCGWGAVGIDNMWHDLDENGVEMGAGSNPMWHAKNLERGILPSYLSDYGLDPVNDSQDKLVGTYTRHYDSVAVAPWLWNAQKRVFLSTEDEESMATKVQYLIDKGIGGVMFWELAGDYDWYPTRNNGQGEYFMGSTLTKIAYDKIKTATPYGNKLSNRVMPAEAVDVVVSVTGFKVGDQNYPINPKLQIVNNTGVSLPGGTEFQFDIPTSAPDTAKDQSGAGLKVIESGHTGNNVGGLKGDFHRISFSLPAWQALDTGATYELDFVYYLPISGPMNYTVKINGKEYALKAEYPNLPTATITSGTTGGGSTPSGTTCTSINLDPNSVNLYPNWTAVDHANGGDKMRYNNAVYQANWWTATIPGGSDWTLVCTY